MHIKKTNITVIYSSHLSKEENILFEKHVANTIGVKNFKIVGYPNFNEFSLPEIYNKAIDEHNTEDSIMIFMHNDIIFKKNSIWGRIILTKFNNSDYSIIGVAGGKTLINSCVWWQTKSDMVGIVEHTDGYNTWVSEYSKEKKGQITPVVLIDGLFMAIDCNNIEYKFDEDFGKYHFYDLPICIKNFNSGFKIGVTTDIRILHKSMGITNQKWEDNRKKMTEKFKDMLPLTLV